MGPFAAGERQRVVIELEPQSPRPVLVVRVKPPGGAPQITRAAFTLYRAGERSPEGLVDFWDEEADEEGCFVLENLNAGAYRLVAEFGTAWAVAQGTWLPAEADVTIPERGKTEITLSPALGGRLRIVARNPAGQLVRARCRVLDSSGRPMRVTFVARESGMVTRDEKHLHGHAPSVVDPALPVGCYRVEISDDAYHAETVDAQIEAGRVTEIDVTLLHR